MRFDVITLFTQSFDALMQGDIFLRALQSKAIALHRHDLRTFSKDKHHKVDDTPYGGGAGMVLSPEPLVLAIESVERLKKSKVLYASPAGRKLDQQYVRSLLDLDQIILVSGRYEGVDERVIEGWVDDCFSIGDYILTSGDLPSMVLIDAVFRLLPDVLGNPQSLNNESFESDLLTHPQYTKPQDFRGLKVPDVLLSGNHQAIERWRNVKALEKTKKYRPDLLENTKKKCM